MNSFPGDDGVILLTGRVLVARQMLVLCGEGHDSLAADLAPYDDVEPEPGDLKVSSSLDAKGKMAYQDGRNECFISGVLCASIYDGTSWRRFDLRSITPRLKYPNPTLLENVVASTRAAAQLAAGLPCARSGIEDADNSTSERLVTLAGVRHVY